MKIIRSVLFTLLTYSLAGPGVPVGFGQGKTAPKTTPKKKSATAAPGSSRAKGNRTSAAMTKSAGKSSGKASSKSSRKSRRQPGQKAPSNDRISEIQAALAKDGSFGGSPTGKWDDDTVEATRKFQMSHGLRPSGKLDAPTLQRLGLGSQTAGVAAPIAPPGSTSRLTSSTTSPSAGADPARQP